MGYGSAITSQVQDGTALAQTELSKDGSPGVETNQYLGGHHCMFILPKRLGLSLASPRFPRPAPSRAALPGHDAGLGESVVLLVCYSVRDVQIVISRVTKHRYQYAQAQCCQLPRGAPACNLRV